MVAYTLIMALRGIILSYKASLFKLQGQPGIHSEFQDNLDHSFKTLSQKERGRNHMAQGSQQSIGTALSVAASGVSLANGSPTLTFV